MKSTPTRVALQIAVIYLLIAGAWVLLSDQVANDLVRNPSLLAEIQTIKGWSFVVVTTGLLFFFLRKMLQNITETRVNLKQTNRMLHIQAAALQSAGDGIAITDRQGKIISVNPAFSRLTGYSKQEALGSTFRIIKSGKVDPKVYKEMWETISTGFTWRGELINRRKDGSFYYEKQTITPVLNDKGEIEHYIAIMEDVTERKRAQEEAARLAAVAEQISEAVTITSPNGDIVYVNPYFEQLTGYKPEEVLGKNPRLLKNDLQSAEMYRRLWSTVASGKSWTGSFINRKKDGTLYNDDTTIFPIRDSSGKIINFASVERDITDQVKAEERIHNQVQRLASLRSIDQAITTNLELPVTLEVIMDQTMGLLKGDAAGLLVLDGDTELLEYASQRGFYNQEDYNWPIELGEGLAGKVALKRKPILVPEIKEASDQFVRSSRMAEEGFQSYFAYPLVSKQQVMGVIEIFFRRPFEPDPEWLAFLEALAGQSAIAIDNAILYDSLQRSNHDLATAYDATLEGWSKALELRDEETEGHTLRVTRLTLMLAQKIGIDDEEMVHIHRGALLHDIGKMGVPDNILLKPGPLTDEEWQVMRRHTEYAYQWLSSIDFLQPALPIPYSHHEKWDGSGYPQGLKGEQIPLPARLFAVADVWDALTSDRPYRKAWSESDARRYLKSQAGKHFDPEVVKEFFELLKEGAIL